MHTRPMHACTTTHEHGWRTRIQNPMMQQMMQNNPQMAAMLENPDFLRQLSDPNTMQQVGLCV